MSPIYWRQLLKAMHSFTEEPSFIFSHTFYTSFILTLITHFVASSMIAERYIPDVYSKLDKKEGFLILFLAQLFMLSLLASQHVIILLTGDMGTNLVYSKSQLGFTVLQLSLRYFVSDFVFCCMDSNLRWEKASMIHHMAVIIGMWLTLYFQGRSMFFCGVCYISKLSTPVVNTFWVLLILNQKGSLIASITMVVVFFLCRILAVLMDPASTIVLWYVRVWTVFTYAAFDALNILWF